MLFKTKSNEVRSKFTDTELVVELRNLNAKLDRILSKLPQEKKLPPQQKRAYHRWTEKDLQDLYAYYQRGESFETLGSMFGVSARAAQSQIALLIKTKKLKPVPRREPKVKTWTRWTPARKAQLQLLVSQGYSHEAIGRKLGTTCGGVTTQLCRMNTGR